MKSIFLINKSKLHIKKKLYYLVNINKIRFFLFVCLVVTIFFIGTKQLRCTIEKKMKIMENDNIFLLISNNICSRKCVSGTREDM